MSGMQDYEAEFQTQCVRCGETKFNGFFTPRALSGNRVCRACIRAANTKQLRAPGVDPGYSWRGKCLPERAK